MIEDVLSHIRNIFVGRHSELRNLGGLWDLACMDEEHLVYVFLNAPGVGKTTLINHFGKLLEAEGKGLYIRFVCSSNYNSPERININIIEQIDETIQSQFELIDNYIKKKKNEHLKESLKNKFSRLREYLNSLIIKDSISINDVTDAFKKLSRIIPIFFATDEIQEFQKITFIQSLDKEEETALHYYTRILRDLLNSKILIVLSGTRYHILSQIGEKIGSPIRQKVRPIIIKNFNEEEVNSYVNSIKDIIKKANLSVGLQNLPFYLDNYSRFLFAFSGGHPRTIENISDFYLKNINYLLENPKFIEYEFFMEFLLPIMSEFFSNSFLSSDHKKALYELSVSESFSEVKNWILNKGTQGQFLGERPKLIENSHFDDEIKRITYELMNIGIIVQNGNYNYHLTSYFHFTEFLKVYHDHYENFLNQVLRNKFFTLMCGRHSGFGYTFENILAAALIIYGVKNQEKITPIQSAQLRSLDYIKGKIDWSSVDLEKNMLYQTPDARAIDIVILQGEELLLIQITTANPPDPTKFNALLEEIEALAEIKFKSEGIKKVRGWFVSLFNFEKEISAQEDITITTGDHLIPILGKQLYRRLQEIKKQL